MTVHPPAWRTKKINDVSSLLHADDDWTDWRHSRKHNIHHKHTSSIKRRWWSPIPINKHTLLPSSLSRSRAYILPCGRSRHFLIPFEPKRPAKLRTQLSSWWTRLSGHIPPLGSWIFWRCSSCCRRLSFAPWLSTRRLVAIGFEPRLVPYYPRMFYYPMLQMLPTPWRKEGALQQSHISWRNITTTNQRPCHPKVDLSFRR